MPFISLENAFALFERRTYEPITDPINKQRPDQTIKENIEQYNEQNTEQFIEDTTEEVNTGQPIEENEEVCTHPNIRVESSWVFSIVVYYSGSITTRCITCGNKEVFSASSGLLKENETGQIGINWDHITTGRFIPGAAGSWRI